MIELGQLAGAGVLDRPAWLYGSEAGGGRRFLVDLPAGVAIVPLALDGVSFFLAPRDGVSSDGLVMPRMPGTAAIEAWFVALLSWPKLDSGESAAIPLACGDRRRLDVGAHVMARQIAVVRADTPMLRYACGQPAAALVLAGQCAAETTGAGEIEMLPVAACTVAEVAKLSVQIARCMADHVQKEEATRRDGEARRFALDEQAASHALRRLRATATFNRAPAAAIATGRDSLEAALGAIAVAEGMPPLVGGDRPTGPLFDRLNVHATRSRFRFREVSLQGSWWHEEGPPMVVVDAASRDPHAAVWRGGRWRLLDSVARCEEAIDGAVAARLLPSGYAIYASLPDAPTARTIGRFAAFGIAGDVVRLGSAAVAAALAGLLVPVATGSIVGYAVPEGRTGLLADMMVLLIAATLGAASFQVVRALAMIRLGSHVDRRLQAAVWDRVLRLPTSFFRGYSVGDLAIRISGIDFMRRVLADQAANGVIGTVFCLSSLAMMMIYDDELAMFGLGYATVAGVLLFALGRVQLRLRRIVFERQGEVMGRMVEILRAIAKLRVAAAELRAFSRWADGFADQRANDARAGRIGAFTQAAITSLPMLGALGIFAIAAGGETPTEVAAFAAFNSAFGQMTAALLGLAGAINLSIEALPAFARLKPVLQAPLEVEANRVDPGRLGGHVAMRGVWFRYDPEGPWVLEDVDLEVRPGESVAIVGASGSGKSTILRLLLGFETPARGGVFYDGRDLAKLDLRPLRRQIGTVLETAGLVPGSLYENIAGSAPLAREQVQEAVRLAGFEEDVAAMPMGLESVVMEGSAQISGGQRQRVMIARALVRRPRLVFLDQATSALDNRTQAIVTASLAGLNATRIVIAHRLSTVRDADRIIVLEAGRIAESGTYDELMARDGSFHRLVERQLL